MSDQYESILDFSKETQQRLLWQEKRISRQSKVIAIYCLTIFIHGAIAGLFLGEHKPFLGCMYAFLSITWIGILRLGVKTRRMMIENLGKMVELGRLEASIRQPFAPVSDPNKTTLEPTYKPTRYERIKWKLWDRKFF